MINDIGYIIIIICSFTQFIILRRVSNQLTKEKMENKFLKQEIDFYREKNNGLEFRYLDLTYDYNIIKQKLNDIKDKE